MENLPSRTVFNESVDLYVASGGFNGNTALSTATLFANYFGTPLIATFAPNVTAVGTDVIPYTLSNATGPITIDVHNALVADSNYLVAPSQGASGFFGIIGIGGNTIEQITFTAPSGYSAGVDNFAFGKTSPPIASTPEPGSVALLIGIGVSGTLAVLRRRRSVRSGSDPSLSGK